MGPTHYGLLVAPPLRVSINVLGVKKSQQQLGAFLPGQVSYPLPVLPATVHTIPLRTFRTFLLATHLNPLPSVAVVSLLVPAGAPLVTRSALAGMPDVATGAWAVLVVLVSTLPIETVDNAIIVVNRRVRHPPASTRILRKKDPGKKRQGNLYRLYTPHTTRLAPQIHELGGRFSKFSLKLIKTYFVGQPFYIIGKESTPLLFPSRQTCEPSLAPSVPFQKSAHIKVAIVPFTYSFSQGVSRGDIRTKKGSRTSPVVTMSSSLVRGGTDRKY